MSTIFVGAHVIGNLVNPQSWSSMVPDWYGHLFLIYSQDGVAGEDDLILRAGQNGDEVIVVQGGVTWEQSADGISYWSGAAGVGDGGASYYGTVAISFEAPEGSVPNLEAIWQTLNDLAIQVGNYSIDYNRIFQNSNSFINTLLDAVGAAVPEIETAGGNDYWFPAHEHVLSFDWLTLENYTYRLRGAHLLDANGDEVPISDNLHALRGPAFFGASLEGDFLSTFGGNDTLTDASRKDTLEGGTGDDTCILQDDGAADIIITGEGDDIVRGGGAEDRLVLRIALLDRMYEDMISRLPEGAVLAGDNLLKPSERIGSDADTSGIPILGGFWDMAFEGTSGTPLSTGSYSGATFPAQGWIEGNWSSMFQQLVYTYSFADLNGDLVTATVSPFGYSFELLDGDLIITFGYGEASGDAGPGAVGLHTVTIEDFEDGDFGIHIAVPSVAIVPGHDIVVDNDGVELVIGATDPWAYSYIGDAAHVAYINNHASFITIPASLDPASTGSIPATPPPVDHGQTGTGGDDDMSGTGGDDFIGSQAGNDVVHALSGDDRVDGGEGDDILWLGVGADLAIGGSGLDQLYGEGGDDGLAGGDGNDALNGGTGNDLLFGDGGSDTLFGDVGNDLLYGGDGSDSLDGGGGDDRLDGGAGDDTLAGASGLDQLDGGDGSDTLSGGDGGDSLSGGGGNDVLDGDGGDDSLSGGLGDDLLRGGTGNDQLAGDAGNDGLWGSTGNDRLDGGEGNDALYGEGDNDSLFGGAGDDSLSASSGLDILDGGTGNDTLTGGAAEDRFVFSSGYGRDVITDFAGNDFIVLDHALASTFTGAMAHAAQVGNDVVFTFGDDSLVLANKALSALNAGDFEFA